MLKCNNYDSFSVLEIPAVKAAFAPIIWVILIWFRAFPPPLAAAAAAIVTEFGG